MAGAIAQDRQRCQFPFLVEGAAMIFKALPQFGQCSMSPGTTSGFSSSRKRIDNDLQSAKTQKVIELVIESACAYR
jgi:hypothetical protein